MPIPISFIGSESSVNFSLIPFLITLNLLKSSVLSIPIMFVITDNGVDDDDEDIILTATIDHIKICDNSLKEQQLLPGLSNLKPKPTFQCDVCEKVFKKKDSYIHHVVNGSALCKKTCLFNMSLKKQQEKIE